MDKFLFAEVNPEDRVNYLQANCEAVEPVNFMRRFTPEEIAEMKDNLSETAIELNDIREEKKLLNQQLDAQAKPLKQTNASLLKKIKQKAENVTEDCFKYIFHDEGMVGYYTSEGELISSRPMRAEERQLKMFVAPRLTGTNN